jgi:hypothetical protein
MNALKSRFPFVDLLKPEMQAVIPTLFAVAPDQRSNLLAIAATASRLAWDRIKLATGFLGENDPFQPETSALSGDELPDSGTDFRAFQDGNAPAFSSSRLAEALLAETEARFRSQVDPLALLGSDAQGEYLGLPSALRKLVRGEDTAEVLREALEKLQQDRSFDLKQEDSTFTRLDALIGEGPEFIVAGHTHLARALERKKRRGWYFNSGTWVRLIKLEETVLKDKEQFAQVFHAFKAGTMEALDAFPELVIRRLTVVAIRSENGSTYGQLEHAELTQSGFQLSLVEESRLPKPKKN